LLGAEQIREYQLYLVKEKGVSLPSYIQAVCALRFLYSNTLHRPVSIDRIPLPRYERKLPVILSPAEVKLLLEMPKNLSHRTMLTTMYAAGPRISEVAKLKVADIDSSRNVIWIRGGKGRKDRQVLLPPKLLELLRVYLRWKTAPGMAVPRWSARSAYLLQIHLLRLSEGRAERRYRQARSSALSSALCRVLDYAASACGGVVLSPWNGRFVRFKRSTRAA
jgi:site-specific recombinase XerD